MENTNNLPKNDRQTNNNRPDYGHLPDLMTVREVAEFLRVSPLTIKRWGKKGKLSPIRINSRGDRRYTREAVLWLIGKAPQVAEEDNNY